MTRRKSKVAAATPLTFCSRKLALIIMMITATTDNNNDNRCIFFFPPKRLVISLYFIITTLLVLTVYIFPKIIRKLFNFSRCNSNILWGYIDDDVIIPTLLGFCFTRKYLCLVQRNDFHTFYHYHFSLSFLYERNTHGTYWFWRWWSCWSGTCTCIDDVKK